MQVEIRDSAIDGAGRGLFATADFSPGDTVLSLPRLYIAELYAERLRDTCAWCFLRGATDAAERAAAAQLYLPTGSVETKACTGCQKVRYCSKACQTRAWKQEHKYECKPLAAMGPRADVPHGVRAVIKLLGRLEADPGNKDERLLDILKFRPAVGGDGLEQFKANDPEKFSNFQTLAWGSWKYAGEPKFGDLDSEAVAKCFFYNVMCNSLELSASYNEDSLGVGFDPIVCSANHSCDPNVASAFNQPKFLLRALRPIKKGEEILVRYADVSNPFSVRQTDLKNRYYFTCQCSKCSQGPTLPQDVFLQSPDRLPSLHASVADKFIQRHAKALATYHLPLQDDLANRRVAAIQAEAFGVSGLSGDFHNANRNASEGDVKDALRLCMNSGMWSYTRQPVPHLLRQLYVYYINTQQRYQAWRIGLKMYFDILPVLHPEPFHPDRLIDVWSLAITTNSLCHQEEREVRDECMQVGLDLMVVFAGFLFEVHDQIPRSYGFDSPFGRIVDHVFKQTVKAAEPMTETHIREMIRETWTKLEVVAKSVDVLKL